MLETGSRLGPYEILAPLGAGGMGEVYRGRDTVLSRNVAIKVLPVEVATDSQRLVRFKREAQLLAALNHPNIAAIHGLDQADGKPFLVMELVEGEDLAKRLKRGPIPLDEALPIARQIAEALEEAHEHGIVHRDLKPANIALTPDGKVKVLDFGLAKAYLAGAEDTSTPDVSHSLTLTRGTSEAGVILGTARYMSPEQARGKPVDERADIWAFGVVLFEILAGRRMFDGETTTDILAAIVRQEPAWERLPPGVPEAVWRLIRRCLEKDPRQRLHSIADARIEIDEALAEGGSAASGKPLGTRRRSWRRDALLFVMGGLVVGLGVWVVPRPGPSKRAVQRLNIALPADSPLQDILGAGRQSLALSSDGNRLVYAGRRPDGRVIYLRRMDRLAAEPIAGTAEGDMPFLSPDGEWLGFAADGKLKKVPIGGGEPTVLCDAPEPRGASWGDDGTILFAPGVNGGLSRVPASGGAPVSVTTPDAAQKEEGHRWPLLLPGGKAALFSVEPLNNHVEDRAIDVVRIDTGERRTIVRGGSYPRYVDGYLLYGQAGTVFAAPFDLSRLELTGPAVPVLEDVRMDPKTTGRVYVDTTPSGSLVYVPGYPKPGERSLVWVDRRGKMEPVTAEKRAFRGARLSPDGQSVAVTIEGSSDSLWIYDLRRTSWNRLTFEGDVETPAWTPDGQRVVFSADQSGPWGLFWVSADGSGKPEELALRTGLLMDQPSVAPDGKFTLLAVQDSRGDDIYLLSLDARHMLEPFLATPASEIEPALSPSGRFVAYSSNESGRREVYVRPFPKPGRKWTVSTGGGKTPMWRQDERELFYLDGNRLMVVPVQAGTELTFGSAQVLFEASALAWSRSELVRYDVTADGQRFLMVKPEPREEAPLEIVVIPDFGEEMKARLSAGRP